MDETNPCCISHIPGVFRATISTPAHCTACGPAPLRPGPSCPVTSPPVPPAPTGRRTHVRTRARACSCCERFPRHILHRLIPPSLPPAPTCTDFIPHVRAYPRASASGARRTPRRGAPARAGAAPAPPSPCPWPPAVSRAAPPPAACALQVAFQVPR